MSKTGRINKRYSAEFKIAVIEDMRNNNLSYAETVKKYALGQTSERSAIGRLLLWERIYLEGGPDGLKVERRGRKKLDEKKSLDKETETDLIKENQRLKAENQRLKDEIEYMLKLSAAVLAEERSKRKGK